MRYYGNRTRQAASRFFVSKLGSLFGQPHRQWNDVDVPILCIKISADIGTTALYVAGILTNRYAICCTGTCARLPESPPIVSSQI